MREHKMSIQKIAFIASMMLFTSNTFGLSEINVISPSGGQVYYVGTTLTIQWEVDPQESSLLLIKFTKDSGLNYEQLAAINYQEGSYDWKIENWEDISDECYIQIKEPQNNIQGYSRKFEIRCRPGNVPPIVNGIKINTSRLDAPVAVPFSADVTEQTDGIYKTEWDFGSGFSSRNIHHYVSPGTYNVSVKVTDRCGEYDTYSESITIRPQRNTSANSFNKMDFNTVRIAYWSAHSLMSDEYLENAAKYKYNYVQFFVHIRNEHGSIFSKNEFKNRIKETFAKIGNYGLRGIPFINIGSPHGKMIADLSANSTGWNNLGVEAPTTLNSGAYQVGGKTIEYNTPALADETGDSKGFDGIFTEILDVLKQAYIESGVSFPFEFIHLGHDEPFKMDYPLTLLYGLTTVNDQEFIDAVVENGDYSTAFQKLLADELRRRIEQVHQHIDNRARVIIYADLWDAEQNGSKNARCFVENELVTFVPNQNTGIATLPGIANKKFIKDNLILAVWNYLPNSSCDVNGDPYDPIIPFSYLTNNTFKFIYCSAYNDYCNDDDELIDFEESNSMMERYLSSALQYKENCIGYSALQFEYEPEPMQKKMYWENGLYLPKNDFKTDITPIINFLLLD